MPHSESLPEEVLSTIAAKASPFLQRLVRTRGIELERLSLRETFSLWQLTTSPSPRNRIDELVRPLYRWHVQVAVNSNPCCFVRARTIGPTAADWIICEVFMSPIAEKIELALAWADDNIKSDSLVRLVVCPEHQLHMFWISGEGDSEILVVDSPKSAMKTSRRSVFYRQASSWKGSPR